MPLISEEFPVSEMVERVARAMWERTHDGRWEDAGDGQDMSRNIHREDARVAIAAMREPTTDMLWCGVTASRKVRVGGISGMTLDAQVNALGRKDLASWQAMIDEALK